MGRVENGTASAETDDRGPGNIDRAVYPRHLGASRARTKTHPLQTRATEETKRIHEKVDVIAQRAATHFAQTAPRQSFADIARTPPAEGQNDAIILPGSARSHEAPPLFPLGRNLFCTKDMSGAGDDERNMAQIGEVRQTIEAAILRERRYPVKINGANRRAVLHSNDNLLPGATEAPGQENEVTIARMNWLSDKGNGKAYRSMVIYKTKEDDARRLLADGYFYLAGESARTSVFEPRTRMVRCHNRWGLGQKPFVCKEAQRCGRCAEPEHPQRHCVAIEPRLQVYQLNVRKNDKVHLSMINGRTLHDYIALAVAEPWACVTDKEAMTAPNHHSNGAMMIPTKIRGPQESRWPIRRVLWIRGVLEAQQMAFPSQDLAGAIVRFPERDVLVVSVYVEGRNEQALDVAMRQLHVAIVHFRNGFRTRTDVILKGDFDHHDMLWGGEEVTGRRQGEAGPIIKLMGEHGLHSQLHRDTKIFGGPNDELRDTPDRAQIRPPADSNRTDVGGLRCDQRSVTASQAVTICQEVVGDGSDPGCGGCRRIGETRQEHADNRDRMKHALNRNLGRREKNMTTRARNRRRYWDSFVEDGSNIWQSSRYLSPSPAGELTGDKVPPIKRGDGTITSDKAELTEELLSIFFPPLPNATEDAGLRPALREVVMLKLTLEEMSGKVMAAKAWKAPGEDGLPEMVWKQLWPVVRDRVLHLFRNSLREGELSARWKNAEIIPLKKPGKNDCKVAKSWRPISQLSTMGKIPEAIVADRVTYAVEAFGPACLTLLDSA
ncbi:hypothetical protein FSARC_9103 [Fusarium sarcochroum]|uniref:Reverse transcriptase n=1 Tax=Fusarium sarcochroum TaxID=1208366 RepID=A0A8H4TRL3_9HYPO|nr:hypothetical protein FSARC_9103 [Fusarium sarcochroum]